MRARVVVVLVALLAAVGVGEPFADAQSVPRPPARPVVGELGGHGPCGQSQLLLPNLDPAGLGQLVWTFQPTGGGRPRTGGRCDDDRRPVIFFAHGFSGIAPAVYSSLIHNMVSNGHIVVFANYTLLAHPNIAYEQVAGGFLQAATNPFTRGRMDLSHIGIWGHSYGAGMVPWLAQQAGARGWGWRSMWLTSHSAFYAYKVGDGPIAVPAHARAQIIAYDRDELDNRLGIDIFESWTLRDEHKDHITLSSDCGPGDGRCAYPTAHRLPVTFDVENTYADDHLDYYGVFRNWQALSDCARSGMSCDADLGYMGTWSDGHDAPRAVVSDDPVDVGPRGTECGVRFLPPLLPPVRPCPGVQM